MRQPDPSCFSRVSSVAGRAVLFSNASLSRSIEASFFSLTPATDLGTPVLPYILDYRRSGAPQRLAGTPEREFVALIQRLCLLGLNRVLDPDPAAVTALSAGEAADVFTDLDGEGDAPDDFPAFVSRVLSVPDDRFEALMPSLRALDKSLRGVGSNFDMAYGLLISAIESLCLSFDDYVPVWDDVDRMTRLRMDLAIANVKPGVQKKIRNVMMRSKRLHLRGRVTTFAMAHLPQDFVLRGAGGRVLDLQAPEFRACLLSAFDLRSRFGHLLEELQPLIGTHLSAGQDLVVSGDLPMPSYRGLYRVTRAVLQGFVNKVVEAPQAAVAAT